MNHKLKLAVLVFSGLCAISTAGQAQNKNRKKASEPAKAAAPAPAKADDAVIITLGSSKVLAYEFGYVYKKNNEKSEDAYTEKSVREYLDLYTNFKLKVLEAERTGQDTTSAFKKELDTYRKQLAQPYLTEKSVTEKLVKEAYERMKEEVNASHILIMVAPDADPKDTLAAWNKITSIRKKIVEGGEKFEDAAKKNSEDPSAKQNGGSLGYFTALQMVYPFEDAAFNLKKGAISNPIRTRFGYHIIKLNDRRPSQGQVKVAHIMVKANSGISAEDSLAAKAKIDEIYAKLQKGETFESLCSQFSDDAGSKDKGGVLPLFGTGSMIPSFEDVAFGLKNTGDYSKPFLTPYGWHIVKLLEKKSLEPFSEMESTLKQKVNKDSRSELNSAALITRLKKENKLVEIASAKKLAFSKGDTSLISGNWKYDEKDKNLSTTLFTIKDKKYPISDFYKYVKATQQPRKSTSPEFLLELAYKAYLEEELKKYEEEHLAEKYEDYRMLVKEYREGILLFQLMDTKVWTKALEDTTGLKDYFSKNRDKYRWQQRVKASIFNVANQKTLDEVKAKLKAKPFPVNEPKISDFKFAKNAFTFTKEQSGQFASIVNLLKINKSVFVEVVGNVDAKEKSSIGRRRAQAVYDSLVKRGVDAKRLRVQDYGKNKPASTGKPEDNQRVLFNVSDTSNKALEKVINANAPLSVQVTEGMFQKGDNATLDQLNWRVGDYTIVNKENKDRIYYVEIKGIEEPRAKTLDEARGLVISDYQTYLEKQWIELLRKNNPVTINETEVAKLIKKK